MSWTNNQQGATHAANVGHNLMMQELNTSITAGLAPGVRCGEGPGGWRIGRPSYRPAEVQFADLHFTNPSTLIGPVQFLDWRTGNVRFLGNAVHRPGTAATSTNLNDYIFRSQITGERIYFPGQTGYHAWHQALGDRGYCHHGGVPSTGGHCGPDFSHYPPLSDFDCLSPVRLQRYASLLLPDTAPLADAVTAAEHFQHDALTQAQEMIGLGVARVWRSVVEGRPFPLHGALTTQDSEQWNIEYVRWGSAGVNAGQPRLVRVSVDLVSGVVQNWMVLTEVPGLWFNDSFRTTAVAPLVQPNFAAFAHENPTHTGANLQAGWDIFDEEWSLVNVLPIWQP